MRTITLDLERMTSVPALHKYLRSALALPAHYGAAAGFAGRSGRKRNFTGNSEIAIRRTGLGGSSFLLLSAGVL